MDKIIKKLNKLSLPTVILIASLVIGGFYYASEVNKQKSIERQQQIKIEQEKQGKILLQVCLDNAYKVYTSDWGNACQSQGKAGDCTLYGGIPKGILDQFKQNKDECFKKYPQK